MELNRGIMEKVISFLWIISYGFIIIGILIISTGSLGIWQFVELSGHYLFYGLGSICLGLLLNGVSFLLLWNMRLGSCIWKDMYDILEKSIKEKRGGNKK